MTLSVSALYPRVFRSNRTQQLCVHLSETADTVLLTIKIQPMEQYTVPHTPRYRIDEEERYPYVPMTAVGDGVYATEYAFAAEQKYSVKVKCGDEIVYDTVVYAVDDDLAAMKAYKGDTHLHTCRSDGEGEPFDVACAYRKAGFDFIAVTDHHKFAPSLEAQRELETLTKQFYVFRGEEVHNKDMGYFHIVNFNGESSVNDIIETDDAYVEAQIEAILASREMSHLSDPRSVAYRIFVANEIRQAGGVAIMAHPYWPVYGEYHMQTEEFVYHWQHGDFDALEVIAGCDAVGNGNNLQEMIRADMLSEGYTIPVVGSSDAHRTEIKRATDRFNRQFTMVFARSFEDIPDAIKEQRAVAVDRQDDVIFRAVGKFRYVKYARFLLAEFYPVYAALTAEHADALTAKDTARITATENRITDFESEFFAWGHR